MARKAKKRAMKILPMKMSKLINIALKDIRKAEKAEDMIINMSTWLEMDQKLDCYLVGPTHSTPITSKKGICVACAAGSVMRFSLGIKKTTHGPSDVPKNEKQLSAINELREGSVCNAAAVLGLDGSDPYGDPHCNDYSVYNMNIPEYDRDDPEPFHKAMAKLEAKLIKAGL